MAWVCPPAAVPLENAWLIASVKSPPPETGFATISDTVAECKSGPDVPVTVTVEVPTLVLALVTIVMATATGALPGVTGVAG